VRRKSSNFEHGEESMNGYYLRTYARWIRLEAERLEKLAADNPNLLSTIGNLLEIEPDGHKILAQIRRRLGAIQAFTEVLTGKFGVAKEK
jgi:hypothetical protein